MRVRLTKKLASFINGVDLTTRTVGDVFECSDADARILVSERWADWAEAQPLSRGRPQHDAKKSPS